jgi:hypothetical protein
MWSADVGCSLPQALSMRSTAVREVARRPDDLFVAAIRRAGVECTAAVPIKPLLSPVMGPRRVWYPGAIEGA